MKKNCQFHSEEQTVYYLNKIWFDTHEITNVLPTRDKIICILGCGGESGWVEDAMLLLAKDIKMQSRLSSRYCLKNG